jgi:hypothetical protein
MRTILYFPLLSASFPASVISRAFISGFSLNVILSLGICNRKAEEAVHMTTNTHAC